MSIYKKCSLAKPEKVEEPVKEVPEDDASSITSLLEDFKKSMKEEAEQKDMEETLSALKSFTL